MPRLIEAVKLRVMTDCVRLPVGGQDLILPQAEYDAAVEWQEVRSMTSGPGPVLINEGHARGYPLTATITLDTRRFPLLAAQLRAIECREKLPLRYIYRGEVEILSLAGKRVDWDIDFKRYDEEDLLDGVDRMYRTQAEMRDKIQKLKAMLQKRLGEDRRPARNGEDDPR